MNNTQIKSQDILKAFEKLQIEHKIESAKIATKQDIAARQKDTEIVQKAANYSSDSIFQDLAKLQSIFGQSVDELTINITAEVEKLAEIKRAILVENQHLTALKNTQIAAEALNILQQEQQKVLQELEKKYQQQYEILEAEMISQRKVWEQQQQSYDKIKNEQSTVLGKTRQVAEEDFGYNLQRQQATDTDDYENRNRNLDRKLIEEARLKEKDWQERELFLEKNQTKFEEYSKKVESIPTEIEEAIKKSREESIKETYKAEENKAILLSKERGAKTKAFELKIEALNKTIDKQNLQIKELSEQLQAASQQMQQLAMTAVSSAGQAKSTNKK
ncbi:MAG: hypothetical protein KAH84_04145 [Thiomargarita sp.]|nr:hypothetical protein [Thiomargarita sp.]